MSISPSVAEAGTCPATPVAPHAKQTSSTIISRIEAFP
jgi:hypothetical protein